MSSIIFDASRGPEWIANLKESRPLRWENPTTFIEYDHVGTPFVLKDRDFVTRASATLDPAHHSITIEYKAADVPGAPVTSFVRGEMIHAKFTLTALGSGNDSKTKVSGDIHCDPKGSVPKWIVNFFQKDWPINTFRSLRKQAKKADLKVNPKFASMN